MRKLGAILLSLIGGALGATAVAVELDGELTIATDYIFRGVSQTMSAPALQLGLTAEHDSGCYGWAWLSNVDFVSPGGPDDDADLEANFAIGYGRDIGDSVAVSLERVAYLFPGSAPGYDYDYAEWLLRLELRKRHRLTYGYSGDVFNAGGSGRFYSAASTFDVTSRISLEFELAYYDLGNALDTSYAYGAIALNYDLGAVQWRVSYLRTDDSARRLFDASTVGDRVVAAFRVAF